MKQYRENESGGFDIDGFSIPNDQGNRHYNQMQKEIADGEAEILSYIEPTSSVDELRRKAYNEAGVTNEARLDALWDALFENDTTAGDALQIKREAVKVSHPKS